MIGENIVERLILSEKEICEYYNNIWSPSIKLIGRNKNLLLGFHYGLYEKGIKINQI